jgi:hypothetical protein
LVTYGDISDNGMVSAYDGALALQYAIGLLGLTAKQLIIGDVNGDGVVDEYDAVMILRYIVGYIDCFPVDPGCEGQNAHGMVAQANPPPSEIRQISMLEVNAPHVIGYVGSDVTIPIGISDTTGEGIIGVEITLTYDPGILTAIDATTAGTITSGWTTLEYKVTDGQISIAMANTTPLDGAGELVRINFSIPDTAPAGTVSPLTLQRVLLNEDSPGTIAHGSVTTPAEQQVEMDLHQGWNLISLQVDPWDHTLQSVLASVWDNVNSVWAYDANPGWQRYVAAGPDFLNDLTTMETGRGYWISVDGEPMLSITGIQIIDTAIQLRQGWNLAGYNASTPQPREDALASIDGKYSSIWTYDSSTGEWLRYVVGGAEFLNTLTQLEPGRAYWINASEDCVWDISP